MGEGERPGGAGRAPGRRAFSIERHLKRGESAELAFDLGSAAEAGHLAVLVQEVRAMRADMADLKQTMDTLSATTAAGVPADRSARPDTTPAAAAPSGHPPQGGGAADPVELPTRHTDDEAQILRIEVARMVRSLATAKREIAEIKHPLHHPDDDRMTKAASELDEIVAATEAATNAILDSGEVITAHCAAVLAEIGEWDAVSPRMHDIADQVARIMEACNFQDITGQRITKVVRTLNFIEDRIKTIVEDWGRDAFLDLPLPDDTQDEDDESHLLNGPQLQNKGLSQDDIDALFD